MLSTEIILTLIKRSFVSINVLFFYKLQTVWKRNLKEQNTLTLNAF